ncbi:hypothetical protein AB7B51_17530 [Acinetobacter baumannii]|uniref:hypothetical protein n=1 Tax=Acinetobacter baumannii TaxID=470 RepID=UPI0034E2B978
MKKNFQWVLQHQHALTPIGTLSRADYRDINRSVLSNRKIWLTQARSIFFALVRVVSHCIALSPVAILGTILFFWYAEPEHSLYVMNTIPTLSPDQLSTFAERLFGLISIIFCLWVIVSFTLIPKYHPDDVIGKEVKRLALTKCGIEPTEFNLENVNIYKQKS